MLVSDHLLVRDFGTYEIIFITVATVTMLNDLGLVSSVYMLVGEHLLVRDFGLHKILLMMCVFLQPFPWLCC
jgi:hypothetical protein